MSLKTIFTITLFIFAALEIIINCFGITLFSRYNDTNTRLQTLNEINHIFKNHSKGVANNVFLNNIDIIQSRLDEIGETEEVKLRLTTQKHLVFESKHLLNCPRTIKTHFPLLVADNKVGEIEIEKPIPSLPFQLRQILILSALVSVGLIVSILIIIYYWIVKTIVTPLQTSIDNAQSEKPTNPLPDNFLPSEILHLDKVLNQLVQNIKDKSAHTARYNLAVQVAHDIRSPLSVLQLVLKTKDFNQESIQLLEAATTRIQSIAQSLLTTKQVNRNVRVESHIENSILIILREAELLYGKNKIEWKFTFDHPAALFQVVSMDSTQLQRILMNLINNSVEALANRPNPQITISIGFSPSQQLVSIELKDNGIGIKPTHLRIVGHQEFTTKTKLDQGSGSGIGLKAARVAVQEAGGELRIQSEHGIGTTITIDLPTGRSPILTDRTIDLSLVDEIVLVEDDPEIPLLWRTVLRTYPEASSQVKFHHHTSLNELKTMLPTYRSKTLYIFDINLGDSSESGLDAILKHKLEKSSLVSSNVFMDEILAQKLSSSGLKFLPKSLIQHVELVSSRPNS